MKRLLILLGVFCTLGIATGADARIVSYNVKSHIWHNQNCQHFSCKNCIKIEESEARRRGGRACFTCGG